MGWPKGKPRSEDVRARISASLAARLASDPELVKKRSPIGRRHTPETKAKIARAHVGMRHTDEARRKIGIAKTGRRHSEAFKAHLSALFKGRQVSKETRKKLSLAGLGHKAHHAKKSNFWHGNTRMRSSYELRVARALDELGIKWTYEPRRFNCGAFTYTPDFYLEADGIFWEVKGWFGPESQRKIAAFRRQYPEVPLVLFDQTCLDVLEVAAARKAA